LKDRALCVLQNRLVILVELFAGVKVEIFAPVFAPVDLALAVVGLDVPLELGKERVLPASSLASPPP
jgi:hypothetical protein